MWKSSNHSGEEEVLVNTLLLCSSHHKIEHFCFIYTSIYFSIFFLDFGPFLTIEKEGGVDYQKEENIQKQTHGHTEVGNRGTKELERASERFHPISLRREVRVEKEEENIF